MARQVTAQPRQGTSVELASKDPVAKERSRGGIGLEAREDDVLGAWGCICMDWWWEPGKAGWHWSVGAKMKESARVG